MEYKIKYYKFKITKKYKFYSWLHEKTFKFDIFLGDYNIISKKHFRNMRIEWNAQVIIVSFFPIKMGAFFLFKECTEVEEWAKLKIKELLKNQ